MSSKRRATRRKQAERLGTSGGGQKHVNAVFNNSRQRSGLRKETDPVATLTRDQVVKSPLLDVPQEERDRIAMAVRRAVGTIDRTGGGGACVYYSLAGYSILRNQGFDVVILCGSWTIAPDPSDPGLLFEINGESPGAAARGEYHTWLASPDGVIIDFSACDWPAMAEGNLNRLASTDLEHIGSTVTAFGGAKMLTDEQTHYRQPHLDYLWAPWNAGPGFVRFRPNLALTNWLDREIANQSDLDEFMMRACLFYRNPDMAVFALPN